MIDARVEKASNRLILLAAILTANISQFIHIPIWGRSRSIFIPLLLVSLTTKSWKTIACVLVLAMISLDGILIPPSLSGAPVIGFLIPFLIAAVCLLPFSHTRSNFAWIRKGEIDRVTWILILAISLLSTLALVLWAFWTNNLGLGEQFVKGFGQVSKVLIFAVLIPAFALLNALAEEFVYRGLVQESLTRVFRNPAIILLLQASAFAAVHYASGFPNGIIGYVMVLVYGIMLGYLRMRTKGILAPYIAHVIADATIAMLLVYLVK